MVFRPQRLEQAISAEVEANSKEWQKYLKACHELDSSYDPNSQPFVSRDVMKGRLVFHSKSWNGSQVLFQQKTGGKSMEFTPQDMKMFWKEASCSLGEYLLEQGYGQIVLSEDSLDSDVRVANVRLNVFVPNK